jgi:hypothetical protein
MVISNNKLNTHKTVFSLIKVCELSEAGSQSPQGGEKKKRKDKERKASESSYLVKQIPYL